MGTTKSAAPEQLLFSEGGMTQYLPTLLRDPVLWWWPAGLLDGLVIGVATVALTVVLEALSSRTALKIRRTPKCRRLYAQAVWYNFVNILILGPAIYALGVNCFAATVRLPLADSVRLGCFMICGHACGYYFSHRAMHTKLLWWTHRFHHQFNDLICPMAANAVSHSEFVGAYMLPFFVLVPLIQPDALAIVISGSSVSFANLLIHTPALHTLSERLPSFVCTTSAHFKHHRQFTTNYGASTFKFDYVIDRMPVLERVVDAFYDRFLGEPLFASAKRPRALQKDGTSS